MLAHNEEELKQAILRKLGLGRVKVELTEDHMDDVIHDTRQWFNTYWGFKQSYVVIIPAGVGEIDLPNAVDAEIDDVVNAWFSSNAFPLPPLNSEDLLLPFPLQVFMEGGNVGLPFSGLVQQLQTIELGGRILSVNIDWEYDRQTGMLRLLPVKSIDIHAFVEVILSNFPIEELKSDAAMMFEKWATAEAKETLGRIRSKFDSYPTAGGDRSLDGDKLLAEAEADKEKIMVEVRNLQVPCPFVIG